MKYNIKDADGNITNTIIADAVSVADSSPLRHVRASSSAVGSTGAGVRSAQSS